MSEGLYLGLFLALAVPFGATILAATITALLPKRRFEYRGKHIFITGGSEGLGRSLALQLVGAGADVTIVARRPEVLQRVLDEATAMNLPGRIFYQSADVTDPVAIQAAVTKAIESVGPISILIPCAGKAHLGYARDLTAEIHRKAMDLNFFGTLNVVNAVLPTMRHRKEGSICFVTSAAGMASYVGYSAYSPSKYAIRGLADSLRNELSLYNISIHIAYPTNIDTPGYAEEMLIKPAECKAIEASDPLYPADKVAKSILNDLKNGVYSIYCGDIGVNLLGVVSSSMSPRNNLALDMLLSPIAILIAPFVRRDWDKHAKSSTIEEVDQV